MSDILFSPHWYRIANLKPKLHSHVEIHRHDYRGLIWYIVEDSTTGRNHRFNPAAYQFIGFLDGTLSVQEIYDELNKKLGDFAPNQDDIIQLMGQLHGADLIQTNKLVDTEELFERQARLSKSKFNQKFINPLSQKIPLWDPEEFLAKHLDKVQWLFSQWMALIWLILIVFSGLQAATHWSKITSHFEVNALAPYNFLIMFLLYPLIKILHEFGHAFANKLKGGEVHELGINFLMFMPIPYVNVSSSANFPNKYDRMLVSAAGILVESFVAALGLLLFLTTEAGVIHEIGFDIMLTGGVSSLFFNGNPLLKYDGYYIVSDLLGIPNLYQRSAQYWRYFFQRYLLRLERSESPATASGETAWFIVYSISSQLYRLSILWFICVYVTEKFFFAGVLLALWLVSLQIVLPLYKAVIFTIKHSGQGKKRNQTILSVLSFCIVLIGLFCFMPIPSYTLTEGVVWLPEESQIKAEQDGFIGSLQVKTNQFVDQGQVVLTMYDDGMEATAKISRAKLVELQSQFRAEKQTDLVKANIFKEEIMMAQSELDHLNKKNQTLSVKALKSGQVLLPEADDLPGRFIHHGELIGYLINDQPPTIRTVVTQDNIGQVRERIVDVKVRLANRPHYEYAAIVLRQAPEATNKLPSAALTPNGGGKIPVDPNQQKDLVALQKVFLMDLQFTPSMNNIPIGTRAYVRINHGGESLSVQWYRRIRQAFLRQLNV
jgi:putative peptide zinc metalloprotease protein